MDQVFLTAKLQVVFARIKKMTSFGGASLVIDGQFDILSRFLFLNAEILSYAERSLGVSLASINKQTISDALNIERYGSHCLKLSEDLCISLNI